MFRLVFYRVQVASGLRIRQWNRENFALILSVRPLSLKNFGI